MSRHSSLIIVNLTVKISPYLNGLNKTAFVVRKELTPVEGDTKCSIYLEKTLDYEIHSSYVMQIIAEVSDDDKNSMKY